MSLMARNAARALQAVCADDGLGSPAARALMAIGPAVAAAIGVHPIVIAGAIVITVTLEFIRWWKGRKRIAQCKLVEGVPKEGGVAYQQHVSRCSYRPYTFKFSHPTDTITGIACVPVDEQTQSPEAEVIEGGINYSHVTIRLTPVDEGNWQCNVALCTKPSSARPDIEADSTRATLPPADTTRAAAPPAEITRPVGPAPAVPAGTTAATPALISQWVVTLVVLMMLMFVMIMIMMTVIIVRG